MATAKQQAQPDSTAADASAQSQSIATNAIEITLEQFGVELSQRDNRVELLNAFIFTQSNSGYYKDTEANYQARFVDFLNKPV